MDKLHYLYIFFQSNLIEIVVYYFCYRGLKKESEIVGIVSYSNSITHPIVFFGFMSWGWSYWISILLAEVFAILAEAGLHAYFARLSFRRTLIASSFANLISWQLAPILTYALFF